ncbi:DUF500 and SH3 domain [Chlorella sorokiniana]|uniref:DUF500 and SH3 domain n=1 Tax=Chlorella sorokiniana TaxID=3076 RepID=A0A2P6TEA4_CHLSO|nr:DUF500 and SH3 domain [Chlorella sorokiniana]|eukprot:PRW20974.1 DUF500 and SH3 domain [Chlorella sorokiniana]
MSLDGSMRGGRRPGYPPSGLSSMEGSMRGGIRPSYQSVRALFEQAEETEEGRSTASPPLPACPSPSPPPCQQPPLALLERLSSRAPMPGLERLSFQGCGGGLRGGLPVASREASRACSIEGSFRGGLRCWSGEGLDQLAAAGGWSLPVQPRPVLAYTGRHHALLERRCQEALSILDRVQRPAPLRRGAPATGGSLTPQLPKTAFRFAKGLVFVSNQRAGALAGYSWGHGVLIARLPGGWSAPLLLRQRSGSLGLLLGWQRVEACHVLQTDDQVHAFSASHSQGMELGAEQADPDAAQQPRHKDGGAVRLTGACSATLADGVFWDVSVRAGCTFVDDRLNASLYSDGVTAAEILGGRVALPEEFLPLYQAVDALAAEAQTTRHTLSKFSLVRQQSRQQQQQQGQQPRQLARQLSNGSASSASSAGPGPSLLRRIRASFKRRSGSSSSAGGCDSPTPHDRGWRRSVSSASASDPASGAAGAAGSPGPSEEPTNDFKLFGGVSIDFEERFTYEAQEAAEAEAEAAAEAAGDC